MRIVFVGSGNVATCLAHAFVAEGHIITQVYSQTIDNAQLLAESIRASAVDDFMLLNCDVDLVVIAVKDDAIADVVGKLPETSAMVVHTAGSIDVAVLSRFVNYGVLYPFQTFTKTKSVNILEVPLLVEGSSAVVEQSLLLFAETISNTTLVVSSSQRQQLHLAAVFACNFVNHLYVIAHDLLKESDLPFTLLLPLIGETAHKVEQVEPRLAQTGPASRDDIKTIEVHKKRLSVNPELKSIYELLTNRILKNAQTFSEK